MGCMATKQTMVQHYRTEHMPVAKRMASNPRELSNGNTFIPVNYINGRYPSIYPVWLKPNISRKQYMNIISQLNKLNKSSLVWSEKRMVKYAKLPRQKAKILIEKDKHKFNDDLDVLLLDINTKILNHLGLNVRSTLRKLYVKPCEMGVIITHIHIPYEMGVKTPHSDGGFIILSTYENGISHRKTDSLLSPNY
eukprot:483176_1